MVILTEKHNSVDLTSVSPLCALVFCCNYSVHVHHLLCDYLSKVMCLWFFYEVWHVTNEDIEHFILQKD